MAKKKPRRSLLSMADTPAELEAAVEARRGEAAEPAQPKKQPNRKKLTLDIEADLIREVRVACVELPPKLTGGGPSGFVSRAVEAYLASLRSKYNDGEPFASDEEPRIPRGPRPRK